MAGPSASPIPDDIDGILWISYPYRDGMVATVALLVELTGALDADGKPVGKVVGCPPMAWSWAMGGDARAVKERAIERGIALRERYGEDTIIRWIPTREGERVQA